jgi:hypothetical protein
MSNKRLAVMQPYFFPYIGYFQLIKAVDVFVIYDDVNFIKKGWINRNRILNGSEPLIINVNVEKVSQNKLISETYIKSEFQWSEKILKQLQYSYSKAQMFSQVFPLIEEIIDGDWESISALNRHIIQRVCHYLQIDTYIVSSSSVFENKGLSRSDRLIDIAKSEDCDIYINPISGAELYSKEMFKAKGIHLLFLKSDEIVYKQFKYDFVPFLSIIDVMMFNSVSDIKLMLEQFKLK